MKYTFDALAGEYSTLLARMVITRQAEVNSVVHRLLPFKDRYAAVWASTGVLIALLAALNERESGSRFNTYLGNGDPLNAPTVHVPKGRGPFRDWEAGAKDALHLDGLDKVKDLPGGWTWARACYEAEIYNGMGYRQFGVHSPYLWSGSNIYDNGPGGKFDKDGHFVKSLKDKQLGVIPLMAIMVELDPSLALIDALPAKELLPALTPTPLPVPLGHGGEDPEHGTKWIQASLNELDPKNPISVDGVWGRKTRRAVVAFQTSHHLEPDGIAGPKTLSAIEDALRAEVS